MSAPIIFSGRRAKLLTADAILNSDGSINDNNGIVNLIKNGHAEVNTTGWTVSKNTSAASRPDSGFVTSSTNITWTRNTTNPIDGQADFLYTKDAANRQGEQVYYGFTVSKKHRAKVVQIEVDYLVNSGTFSAGSSSTDSDVIVYIYDVTNSTFIEPSSFKFLSNSSTIADKFIANFQTSATGSSYRILFHQATTSASAFAVQFKEIKISPCQHVYGTLTTDWVSYTPTGSWSNTTYAGKWRRVGDSMEVNAQLTLLGTPTSATLTVALPSGYTIDTAKLANSTIYDAGLGIAHIRDYSGNFYTGSVRYNNTTSVLFTINNGGLVTETVPMTWASADQLSANFSVPITGWSSSTQQSDGYDGRQIGFRANNSSTSISGTPAKVVWTNTDKDDVAGYSSGTYTIKSAGWYDVDAALYLAGTPSLDQTAIIYIYRNGASVKDYTHRYKVAAATTTSISIHDTYYFLAGDTVEIYAMSEATSPSISSSTTKNVFSLNKRQSPTTISATEVVSFDANTSTTAGSTSTPLLFTVINDNSHGAYSSATGKFTAPYPGIYHFSVGAYFGSTSTSVRLYKNGTYIKQGSQSSLTSVSVLSTELKLIAGDTVEVRPDASATANGSPELNFFSGFKIK